MSLSSPFEHLLDLNGFFFRPFADFFLGIRVFVIPGKIL